MAGGADAFARGDYGTAERDWQRASLAYAAAEDVDGRLDAGLNLGIVQQQLGRFQPHAIQTLEATRQLAAEHGRTDKLIEINSALGVAYTFVRQPKRAEELLNESLSLLAEQGGDSATEARVRNNLGNLYAAWAEVGSAEEKASRHKSAFDHYTRSADVAASAGDASLSAKATVNAALSAARGGRTEQAGTLNARAIERVGKLPASLDKANLLIAIGQADQLLLSARSSWPEAADVRSAAGLARATLERRAFDAHEQARLIAKKADNPLVGSYAVGYQGRLYEAAGRHAEALALTRRAVLLAQSARSAESLYLWHWQTGRILKAQGDQNAAIAAYTRARDTLETVRSDLALGYGNRGFRATFRSEVGPLYYELADLLLARADAEGDDAAKVQQYLADARDTVERLRVGELESYLEDACVNQAQARQTDLTRDLARIPRGNPAVVYMIPLADRVEVLVTTRAGMTRVTSPGVGAAQLTREVRDFRRRLENRVSHRYLTGGKRLYDWLIKPVEPLLAEQGIDTLVFVPDGALRTVPMSALYDGTDFLVARYAIAVSPGLSLRLSDDRLPEEVSRAAARVLASGLSVTPPGEDFAPLPNVGAELSSIERLYGATKLVDEDFRVPTFSDALSADGQAEEFSIVHIASHGEFAADVADTFLLTYDGRMNLNDLESLLRPYQLRGRPIDLLTLSCCQTSAGDDEAARERASLGLGGLAVKAGARSAMASLWFANDAATSELVATFYEHLRDHPEDGKAQALRHAQLKLIRNEDLNHPLYWAPFLMIGDWL